MNGNEAMAHRRLNETAEENALLADVYYEISEGGLMTPYETARNRLIPHATRHADKTCGKKPWANKVEWAIKWNQAYLAEMDRLVKFTRLDEGD